ncbi:MAG: AfsR/SARP family transcriptional regulator [Acidimicrobiales bacterium]
MTEGHHGVDPPAPSRRAAPSGGSQIEVMVLGPVRVRGLVRPFTRSAAMDLVVYLGMHPGGAANAAWASALWPEREMAPTTLHSTASAARRALGQARSGEERLPHGHGRLRLSDSVVTDWARFQTLSSSADESHWETALSLVRGRPFDGLAHGDWAVLEGFSAQVEEGVAHAACRLADAMLERHRPASAAAVARAGLRASPYDERLYRRLLVAADHQGNPAGVERVMAELLCQLDCLSPGAPRLAFDLEAVHPETACLYERLSRRRLRETGRGSIRQ